MNPELEEYARQFAAGRRDAELLLQGITEPQLTSHPVAIAWVCRRLPGSSGGDGT